MESCELLTKVYRLINLYNAKAKKPHTYTGGLVLYPAQSHMIEIIGDNQAITVTRIAEEYMITKGAVSQILKFLDEKGLIVRKPSQKGGRTTELYLSQEGKRILAEHREMHRPMTEQVAALTSQLSPDTIAILEQMADTIEENIRNL
ncbi:MAG: MarR family transcriptional regulator [Clostridia bacterium]|jgi:DNA-binding MarR family transcriptional regulator|nr:MarR family transcriptional regulator [Clostridia bacterium]